MPRFAILCHDSPRGLHYDFFLERDDVLLTWALPELPSVGKELAAERLLDHRLLYLDYEGPISGDRGTVTRWDRGEYAMTVFEEGFISVAIKGAIIVGQVDLRRVDSGRWIFTWIER